MQGALAKVPQIKDLTTDAAKSGGKATFKCAKDFDYKKALDAAVASGNSHLKDWSLAN